MKVSVIGGTGQIGSRVAARLASHGVDVTVAASSLEHAQAAAEKIGHGAKGASVDDAIAGADIVVLAVWFAQQRELLAAKKDALVGKIVVDPSNNISFADGKAKSENPEGVSAAEQISKLLPAGAHYVKAFGSMSAPDLEKETTDDGKPVVMFYAADESEKQAGDTVADLIRQAGWEPVRVGGIDKAGRIEVFGDLHPFGGLQGRLLGKEEAESLI